MDERVSNVQRGSDLRFDLEITLEDAANGKDEKLSIPRLEKCEPCEGTGQNLALRPSSVFRAGDAVKHSFNKVFSA